MAVYKVGIMETYIRYEYVEAESPEEAETLVHVGNGAECSDDDMDFQYICAPSYWQQAVLSQKIICDCGNVLGWKGAKCPYCDILTVESSPIEDYFSTPEEEFYGCYGG